VSEKCQLKAIITVPVDRYALIEMLVEDRPAIVTRLIVAERVLLNKQFQNSGFTLSAAMLFAYWPFCITLVLPLCSAPGDCCWVV